MTRCLFVTDLHGSLDRYDKLFRIIVSERPDAVFMGGDLLPHGWHGTDEGGFISSYLAKELEKVRDALKDSYPRIFAILGNDDGRYEEGERE